MSVRASGPTTVPGGALRNFLWMWCKVFRGRYMQYRTANLSTYELYYGIVDRRYRYAVRTDEPNTRRPGDPCGERSSLSGVRSFGAELYDVDCRTVGECRPRAAARAISMHHGAVPLSPPRPAPVVLRILTASFSEGLRRHRRPRGAWPPTATRPAAVPPSSVRALVCVVLCAPVTSRRICIRNS